MIRSTWFRALITLLGFLLLALLLGPLLVPVPPLEDTVPPQTLADPDSQFVEVDGLQVHLQERGAGEPNLLLLHGFAASTFTWREVIDELGQIGRTVAYDRPAFGLTERPPVTSERNPYTPAYQTAQVPALMNELGMERAILVGNSAGGTTAVRAALAYPERVQALILVDPAIYVGGGAPSWAAWLLDTPQAQHLGPLLARQIKDWGYEFGRRAWHDPASFTDEVWQGYTKPLRAESWDNALWQLTRSSSAAEDLQPRLDELTLPVLVITGDDDRIVPTAQSIRLAGELPNAELVVIPACGHVPQEECPEAFMTAVNDFLAGLEP
jgi:pimeloyl-ACP methyl ester carboxylesterase